MSQRLNLNSEDLLRLLTLTRSKNAATEEDEALIDTLTSAYFRSDDLIAHAREVELKPGLEAAVRNPELLQFIIHVLAVLTGYPESSIGLKTKLDSIGVTPIKRETLRKRINKYLRDQGSSRIVTSAEAGKCKTVEDIYNVALSKL